MNIEHVIKHFGTQSAVARSLGLSQPTVAMWRKRKSIPPLHQLRLQAMTEGKLRADPKILTAGKLSRK